MTLTEFLLARIAEDEAHWEHLKQILAGAPSHSMVRGEQFNFAAGDGEPPVPFVPRKLLAECDAKRRIVELHEAPNRPDYLRSYCVACGDSFPCPTLRLLALPYADHPDYQPEWRP
jgi:hypothetical protein